MSDETTKHCPSCKQEKAAGHFYARVRSQPSPYCRQCTKVKSHSPRSRFNRMQALVRQRNAEWFIGYEDFLNLLSKPCFYCGGPLAQTGRGCDRIDSKGSYTLENVVPSCAACNWLRHDIFTHLEMIELGHVVRRIRLQRGLKDDEQILTPVQRTKYRKPYRPRKPKEQEAVN